ncbi:eukaryotic translation initiation factor 3 subunit L [Nilaparvata lugens]|uniref:eukaryotic translation initiation factor 3 subunit L n=1 Tax=Nilaparvata lugens TaxID=108931 RepID=UPI000B991731|nr:eukaryotic translation initiation factor 3 subunit L [Nilaparvata lugens]
MYGSYDSMDNAYGYNDPYNGDYDSKGRIMSDVPEDVKKFLHDLSRAISQGNVYVMQDLYENYYPQLTETYYSKCPWPQVEEVEIILNHLDRDDIFFVLYKELYYRHIYARVQPTLQQRIDSYWNYCSFMNFLIGGDKPQNLRLPDQWLWEVIDEFVYQFQSFCHYRTKLTKPDEIVELVRINNQVWSVLCVLNVLHSLVDKSNIKKQLEVSASGGDPESVAGEYGRSPLYKMLGYYSLVGMLRLHSLLGDYYQAIKVLENIDLNKKMPYAHVPACQISTAYYVGFAYMMMRRYSDTIRTFSSILLYINRTKQLFQARTYQNDQINKQTEQMYNLLSICLVLHPQCIDESLQNILREKNYNEKMFQMQMGDHKEIQDCFRFACPKFILPYAPDYENKDDLDKNATDYQVQVFMDEVRQQKMLPTIRSYLKLYTTLPISKLAIFMSEGDISEEELKKNIEDLKIHLLCFKHKMKNVVWTKGGASGLEGSFQSGSELDFYIDNDMIHIADTKVANRYGDFFIRKILKFEELNKQLHAIKI